MKGDFSRITFDPANHFSSVLLQQGRVTLDADPNEQASILLHYVRTLARDLIGAYGGPFDNFGFELDIDSTATPAKLTIGAGRYYIDGILCESDGYNYAQQPDYTPPSPDSTGKGGDPLLAWLAAPAAQPFWIYLDVWERLVTWIEDDHIREVALGGPDTCARTKVICQVKAVPVSAVVTTLQNNQAAIANQIQNTTDPAKLSALQAQSDQITNDLQSLSDTSSTSTGTCAAALDSLLPISNAQMAAQLDPGQQIKDPCTISPSAAYRGAENQLYRVEIHQGSNPGVTPSFKWSRDNGSVATRWLGTSGNDLLVTTTRGFAAGNWVELSDDTLDLNGEPGQLVKLAKVQNGTLTVDPDSVGQNESIAWSQQLSNPKVRRWDQTENDVITLNAGAVPIVEASATNPNWIDLEDGVQVQFAAGGVYRSGDYWLIPARVATGTIDWPANADGTLLKSPQGVEHHYAPLGFFNWSAANGFQYGDCRCRLIPTNSCDRVTYAQDNRANNALTVTDKVTAKAQTAPASTPAAAPAKPATKKKVS